MPLLCSKAVLWSAAAAAGSAIIVTALASYQSWKLKNSCQEKELLSKKPEITEDAKEDLIEDEDEEEEEEEEEKEHPKFARRRAHIRTMAREAWDAYCQAAWGQDVAVPARRRPFNFAFGPCSGHTLVVSLSTLWLLGLKEDYRRGRRWLAERFTDFAIIGREQWEVAPTVADYLGSFLSCYALTEDQLFLEKAVMVAEALAPAYESSPTGIPYPSICLKTGVTQKRTSKAGGDSTFTSLSAACAGLLELPLLSDLTGSACYRGRATKIISALEKASGQSICPGLTLDAIDVETGLWATSASTQASLFHAQAGFYQGLVKAAIQQQQKDSSGESSSSSSVLLELYKTAMDAATSVGLFTSKNGHLYGRTLDTATGRFGPYLEYTGAYLGAILALGASALKNCVLKKIMSSTVKPESEGSEESIQNFHQALVEEKERIQLHRRLAQQLTETFHMASVNRKVSFNAGLPPWRIYFEPEEWELEPSVDGLTFEVLISHCILETIRSDDAAAFNLGPELAESYFVLWRLTGEEKWREYSWRLALAIYEHCRVEMPPPHRASSLAESSEENPSAFSGFSATSKPSFGYSQLECRPAEQTHPQPANFLGATLKYLYLTQLSKPKAKKSPKKGGATFRDNSLYLPLEEWVFNTAGQPLPIAGHYHGLDKKVEKDEKVKSGSEEGGTGIFSSKCTVM